MNAMLTPIQQLPLTEAQRQTALNHNILALDLDCTALLHQPERGSGVYVLDQYAQPRGAAVTCALLLALHLNGTCPRRWSFYSHRDVDALRRAENRLHSF